MRVLRTMRAVSLTRQIMSRGGQFEATMPVPLLVGISQGQARWVLGIELGEGIGTVALPNAVTFASLI